MAEAIRISDDYRIIPDALCYQLQRRAEIDEKRRKKPREGTPLENWVLVGYWPNLTQLCDALAERHLLKGGWKDMREAITEIRRLRDDIRHAVLLVLAERPGDPTPGERRQLTINA